MDLKKPITRRESIKKLAVLSGGIALSGAAQFPMHASAESNRFIIEGLGQTNGYNVKDLARKVFEAAGGIEQYISKGDVVVIKPNISWARKPELAATTHPEVLETVIELCQDAGAKKVRIVDHTIHDARRCFALSGAGKIAKNTGAELVYPRSSLMRRMKIRGDRLDVWPVFVPTIETDKLINLPVAKHHSLTTLTLGMKNWIGSVGGSRWSLHQDINQTIVDLAQFFKPTITLIDAITSCQAITEAERNLSAKLPHALPAFHLLVDRCLRVVADPHPEDLIPHVSAADPKDLPILVAAVRESCPWLVTFNLRHFQPGLSNVTVLRPGDFVLRVRDLLAQITPEPDDRD